MLLAYLCYLVGDGLARVEILELVEKARNACQLVRCIRRFQQIIINRTFAVRLIRKWHPHTITQFSHHFFMLGAISDSVVNKRVVRDRRSSWVMTYEILRACSLSTASLVRARALRNSSELLLVWNCFFVLVGVFKYSVKPTLSLSAMDCSKASHESDSDRPSFICCNLKQSRSRTQKCKSRMAKRPIQPVVRHTVFVVFVCKRARFRLIHRNAGQILRR